MKYNDVLKDMHKKMRESTIKKIQSSIDFIKENGGEKANISPNKLMECSGLSRAVLYKSHILKMWNSNLWEKRYGNIKETIDSMNKDKELKVLQIEIDQLNKGLAESERKVEKLKESFSKEQERRKGYEKVLDDKIEENQRLKGKIVEYELLLSAVDLNK
jgi:predicted RNase H-like nuclease (RuvC/YqgF family)